MNEKMSCGFIASTAATARNDGRNDVDEPKETDEKCHERYVMFNGYGPAIGWWRHFFGSHHLQPYMAEKSRFRVLCGIIVKYTK